MNPSSRNLRGFMSDEEQRKLLKIQNLPIKNRKKSETEKERIEEKMLREICEYEFYNLEEPGLAIKFPYGNAKNQHTFTFFHGGKYKLPRFMAKHIEECQKPIWKWRPDGLGGMHKEKIGSDPRFQLRQVYGA